MASVGFIVVSAVESVRNDIPTVWLPALCGAISAAPNKDAPKRR